MGLLIGGHLISAVVPVGPQVSPITTLVSVISTVNPTISGVSFNLSGTEFNTNANGLGSYSVSRGLWLDSGLNSEVWVERTINSGALDHTDPGVGRLVLSTTRSYAVSDASVLGGAITANVTFKFFDAASGGNQIGTVTADLTAERISGG